MDMWADNRTAKCQTIAPRLPDTLLVAPLGGRHHGEITFTLASCMHSAIALPPVVLAAAAAPTQATVVILAFCCGVMGLTWERVLWSASRCWIISSDTLRSFAPRPVRQDMITSVKGPASLSILYASSAADKGVRPPETVPGTPDLVGRLAGTSIFEKLSVPSLPIIFDRQLTCVRNIRYCSATTEVPDHGVSLSVACACCQCRKTRWMSIAAANCRSVLNNRTDRRWVLPEESRSKMVLPSKSCTDGRPRSY